MFVIEDELKKIPDKPGVYIMKNSSGVVIYVGKAISLKKRVRQYFAASSKSSIKVSKMVQNIKSFDYIMTDNEVEALVLECNLIKKYRPKYNVLYKDDKNYPYIKITLKETYPRVFITRRVVKDGSRYFGPYTNVGALNETMSTIKTLFSIRMCNKKIDGKSRQRPCLNYYIKKCKGPCTGNVSKDDYAKIMENVIDLLNGKYSNLIKSFEAQMNEFAQNLNFEQAAILRDKIKSIKEITQSQKVVSNALDERDVFAFSFDDFLVCIEVFFIRAGKLLDKKSFFLEATGDHVCEVLNSFVKQFYVDAQLIPNQIILESEIADKDLLEEILTKKLGKKVSIVVPQRGEKAQLVKMVKMNAKTSLENYREKERKESEKNKIAMTKLMKILDLKFLPNIIEAFDISNTGNSEMVGSMVVFEKAIPSKSLYRRFKIKSILAQDDYASMMEVLKRRFKRLEADKEQKLPRLILLDGGQNHVMVAKRAMEESGVQVPIFGMVKDQKHRTKCLANEERLFDIESEVEVMRLIVAIQDEAHRFALEYNKMLRNKRYRRSVLDNIRGVGAKRKKNLLKQFGSVDKIKTATLEELIDVEGVDKATAREIFDYFRE